MVRISPSKAQLCSSRQLESAVGSPNPSVNAPMTVSASSPSLPKLSNPSNSSVNLGSGGSVVVGSGRVVVVVVEVVVLEVVVVVEVVVDPNEMCFPMVPAGGSNDDVVMHQEAL